MAYSLQDFLAQANANTIRANNQYELMITSGYADVDSVMQKAAIYAQGFTLPNRTVEYSAVSFKGYEMTNIVPTRITMEQEHTVTILADVNGELRRAFLAWMGKVINPAISQGSIFEGDRGIREQSTLRVLLFDETNANVIETVHFYNVRIKSVGGLTLTYEGGDKATFEVVFNSTYWEIETARKGAFKNQK